MSWQAIADISEVPEMDEEAVPFNVGSTQIALLRMDGKVLAINNICTHQFALLSDGIVEDGCIECPLHQARFDVTTGKHRGGPACDDLAVYPVKVEDGTVYVAIE